MIKKVPAQEVSLEMLRKSREILFNFLAVGFTNLEPKYYVFEDDRRNSDAESEATEDLHR